MGCAGTIITSVPDLIASKATLTTALSKETVPSSILSKKYEDTGTIVPSFLPLSVTVSFKKAFIASSFNNLPLAIVKTSLLVTVPLLGVHQRQTKLMVLYMPLF